MRFNFPTRQTRDIERNCEKQQEKYGIHKQAIEITKFNLTVLEMAMKRKMCQLKMCSGWKAREE